MQPVLQVCLLLYLIFFSPSEDYAQLCNIPVPGSRRPYGQDALVDFEEHYTPETNPYFVEDRKQDSLLCKNLEMRFLLQSFFPVATFILLFAFG